MGGRVTTTGMDVPFVDLRAQGRELHDEFHEVFESVLSRAAYTMGPELRRVRGGVRRVLRRRATAPA